jgi:predicted YcjX-like family ATPase
MQFIEIGRETFRCSIERLQIRFITSNYEAALTSLGVFHEGFQVVEPGDFLPPHLLAGVPAQNAIPKQERDQDRGADDYASNQENRKDKAQSNPHGARESEGVGCGLPA